jgi:DNA-binding transcriptional ArsR family regulator
MLNTRSTPSRQNDPLASALEWDWGTAYEFILSLDTIFRPKMHGVPAPWAAGVRKRLSPPMQAGLKSFFAPPHEIFAYLPLHLVHEMEPPKDALRFLDFIEAIPERDFSRSMHIPLVAGMPVAQIIRKGLEGEAVSDAEIEEYRRSIGRVRILPPPTHAEARRLFDEMADPATTKRRWLAVMREYYAVFFEEEEARLAPVLKGMLAEAQGLSETTTVSDLIERLSNGFTISEESRLTRLILVPSVWCHPFVVHVNLAPSEMLVAWGAHPPGYRLAPGESVPDQALLVLRALSDPTRLRLLRLLSVEPRTPQALAHELKLSLPTVSHHMRELRLAGLVRLEIPGVDKGPGRENRYTVRWQSAERAFGDLSNFVVADGER